MKPSKAVIAGAAVAGLLTGSLAVRAYAASTSGHAGVSLQTMADAEKAKHACKGKTTARARAVARSDGGANKTPAKAREAAQPTEASRLNSNNQTLAAHIGGRLGRFREGGTASVLSH